MRKNIYALAQAGITAALYYVLTALIFQPVSFGFGQVRVAEAMMLLPALYPATSYGLFAGCLLANLLNPMSLGPVDIVLGSLTTFAAALITMWMGKKLRPASVHLSLKNSKLWLLPIPTVILNALVVGSYLPFLLMPEAAPARLLPESIAMVGLGELVSCYVIGIPLLLVMCKIPLNGRARQF